MCRIALALVRSEPFTGYGGGAWVGLYHNLSSVFFVANETHSFVSQLVIEAGPLALLGAVVAAVGIALTLLRHRPEATASGSGAWRWGLVVGLLALVGHAAFDFDLSYFSLALLAWLVLGTTAAVDAGSATHVVDARAAAAAASLPVGHDTDPAGKDEASADPAPGARRQRGRSVLRWPPSPPAVLGPLAASVAALALLASAALAAGLGRLARAETTLAHGANAQALASAKAALTLDPWTSAAYAVDGAAAPTGSARLRALAQALRLRPDDPERWAAYTQALLAAGRTERAFVAGQRALSAGPWDAAAVLAAADADDRALAVPSLRARAAYAFGELQGVVLGQGDTLEAAGAGATGAVTLDARLAAAIGIGEIETGAPASGAAALEQAAAADPGLRPDLAPWLARAARLTADPALGATARTWRGQRR